ncbi:MAG: molybdenum cofactor biosynthesis protein MoaE [Candidatus Eremiobacteraeota bacterium]|nr:molybdenum cofactor biosynthesis protein MoaE [Candidatus Eremiobacteraeota bacterium]
MIEIMREPLRLEALLERVRDDACGAVVAFLGVVRNADESGRAVDGLSYEAYDALALAEMEMIAAQARERFGALHVAIVHRVGDLALGEASVAVAASAPPRAHAFDACEFAIDELKARVPIWKKERYRDGVAEWRPNRAPAGEAP